MSVPRIMVVEDEVVVAMDIKSKLTDLGYVVTDTVVTGEEAVEKAGESKPDLIFMDIQLAGELDGTEAADQIRRLYGIPVIYLTAHTDRSTLQKAKLSQPYSYVVKPFSESDLQPAIEISLHKAGEEKQSQEVAEWISKAEETLDGAVIVTDDNHIVIQMNALAEQLTGMTNVAAVGEHINEVYHLAQTEDVADLVQDYSFLCEDGFRYHSRSCVLTSANGNRMSIEAGVWTVPRKNKSGNFVIHCFYEDYNRQKEHQDWFSHAVSLMVTARLSLSEKNYSEAMSLYTRGLRMLERNLGRSHPSLISHLEDMARICRSLERNDEAQMLELRAAKIRSKTSVEFLDAPKEAEQVRNIVDSWPTTHVSK